MDESRFNIGADVWERTVDEIFGRLTGVARRMTTINYSELAGQIRTVTLQPDAHAFHYMLGEVSERAFADAGPLLSALVVSKDSRRPGGGFFDLARRLGLLVENNRDAEDLFWGNQVEQVHRWWRDR